MLADRVGNLESRMAGVERELSAMRREMSAMRRELQDSVASAVTRAIRENMEVFRLYDGGISKLSEPADISV
ncbi:g529 [Coccomyxa elongata]